MAWYKSKRGWASVAAATIYALDYWGHLSSAREIYIVIKSHWSSIAPFVPFALFALSVLFFEQERRKSKYPKPYDLDTLKGRTLKLRDEMQAFLDNAPSPDGYSGLTQIEGIQRTSGSSWRVMKLHHGYEFRFSEAVNRIFNEFGERNLRDLILADALGPNRQVNNEEFYRLIIHRLSQLADSPEAESYESKTPII